MHFDDDRVSANTGTKFIAFVACVSTALVMAPAMAHLLALANKIDLPAEAYLVAQQSYQGWELAGIVVVVAVISISALALLVRDDRRRFGAVAVAWLCIASAQLLFWVFIYPTNRATEDWTMLPANWRVLRDYWEYAHAACAVLDLAAVIALVVALLVRFDTQPDYASDLLGPG